MMDRLLSAFWTPVIVVFFTLGLIFGIGEALTYLAELEHKAFGIKEPYAVIAATILTLLSVGAAGVAAAGTPDPAGPSGCPGGPAAAALRAGLGAGGRGPVTADRHRGTRTAGARHHLPALAGRRGGGVSVGRQTQ